MQAPGLRAYVPLPAGLSANAWAARHARDEVPDVSPYGLNRLASYGVDVTFGTPALRGATARVARAVRHRTDGLEVLEAVAGSTRRGSRNADIILAYDERTGVPAAALPWIRSRPPVVTGIGWLTTRAGTTWPAARLARSALPRAALVWSQCAPMLPVLAREWGVAPSRLRFLPFGIDTDFYAIQADSAEPDVIISAGADRYRDHDLLVRAVAMVRRARPAVTLELAASEHVEIPGEWGTLYTTRLDGLMRGLYARSSVVALALRPTITGSGLSVILEAMASGRPVVATDNPGLSDYVRHGVTGLLVTPGDAGSFAAALLELLNDSDRAAEMGRAGAVFVRNRFTSEIMSRELAEMLRHL